MNTSFCFAATALAAFISLIVSAHAQTGTTRRIWISGHGVDAAGCAVPTNPCRTLQFAIDNVMPGGEVDILDPAGYGPATISHAVSIVNDGVGTAGVLQGAASAAAIAINAAPTDAVILRGLNINGLGTGGEGLLFTSGSSLTVENCAIEAFAGNGISILPTSSSATFVISNTTVANNGGVGIQYDPTTTATGKGTINRATVENNAAGIVIDTQNVAAAPTSVTISNSVVNSNGADGVHVANI